MKRWLCLFFLWVRVLSLLLIPGHQASLNQHPHARDRSVVRSGEFVSTLFRVLIATSPAWTRSRAGPSESSTTRFALLTADDVGPPWLDYRGPPGVCGRPRGPLQGMLARPATASNGRRVPFLHEITAVKVSNQKTEFCNSL
jgi:hypothetical protein